MPNLLVRRKIFGGGGGGRTPGHAAGFTTAGTPNQKLELASNSTLQIPAAASVTMAGWFYPTAGGSYRGLAAKASAGTAAGDEYGLQIARPVTTDLWEFFISTGTGYQAIDSAGAIVLNQWNFVCGQYRPSDGFMGLQVGGTFGSTTRTGGNVNTTTNPFQMGTGAGARYYDGRNDAIGLWTRLLGNGSGSDIDQLYNGGAGRRFNTLPATLKTNLISWWDLDDMGLTWVDSAGSNNLTASGGVTSVVGIT